MSYPGWQCYASIPCKTVDISGSELLIDPDTASAVDLLRKLADQYAPDGRSFIAVPFWPGAYALLERRSPMREIYPIEPRNPAYQERELDRIRSSNPGFAVVIDIPIDDREELRFSNSHQLIYRYIQTHMDRLPDSPNPVFELYRAKKGDG